MSQGPRSTTSHSTTPGHFESCKSATNRGIPWPNRTAQKLALAQMRDVHRHQRLHRNGSVTISRASVRSPPTFYRVRWANAGCVGLTAESVLSSRDLASETFIGVLVQRRNTGYVLITYLPCSAVAVVGVSKFGGAVLSGLAEKLERLQK